MPFPLFSIDAFPGWLPGELSIDMALYREFVSVGLKGFDESSPPFVAIEPPYRLPGEKFSSIGDKDRGSKVDRAGEIKNPSSPKPDNRSPGR